MTVKQLIKILNKYDQEAPIVFTLDGKTQADIDFYSIGPSRDIDNFIWFDLIEVSKLGSDDEKV